MANGAAAQTVAAGAGTAGEGDVSAIENSRVGNCGTLTHKYFEGIVIPNSSADKVFSPRPT